MAVVCGTEKYTIKSRSPCPSGIQDCQLVMYKLSTRPLYTQKQKIITSLQWRCCPGHGGDNCDDAGGSAQPREHRRRHGDTSRDQNDHQASVPELHDASIPDNQRDATPPPLEPGHAHNIHHMSHRAGNTFILVVDEVDAAAQHYPEATAVLPAPHMMALVMSQLQPLLQGFNRSLEHLSRQVGDLARDVAQLKGGQRGAELQEQGAAEEYLEAKLDEVFQHISEIRAQMEGQRTDMENGLHSQHAMLHYNLTSFKTDVDVKLKRHQKMLQVSLQAMNATLSELKLEQDQQLEDRPPLTPPPPPPPSDSSPLWEAIERLDNMVVNNTVKVGPSETNVQQLRLDVKELEKLINHTARKSQVLFMETGLEVEDAKVAVLRRVEELAGNLTQHRKRLQEADVDIAYLYDALYQNHSAGADCNCKGLTAAVARLQRGVANVTALANENRLALDEVAEGGAEQWTGGDSGWEPAVEAVQRGLQQVKESLVSERSRTGALELSVSHLSGSLSDGLAEVGGLRERDRKVREEMQHLSGSFNSLLKDAIRHSDVLELLLGEEVLEFLEWPVQDQEANSIPALKEQLRRLQERVGGNDLSIATLLGSRTGTNLRDSPMLLRPDGTRPEHGGDGGDLWNLEKVVEELVLKVQRLEEEEPCPCPSSSAAPGGEDAKLQAEVTWLKRGLEEHLRVFKNVFSNADVLAASEATLELDKLWQLVKSRDGKREKKKRGGGGGGGGANHRSRRESSGECVLPVPSVESNDSLMFVASLNRRGRYRSDTGTFTAPADGFYLFVLTLDLRPGPAHVVLRKGAGGATVALQRREAAEEEEAGPVTGVSLLRLRGGEEVRLELRGGAWAESEDNVFAGLLLHRTT
uniref:EMI domain-containing protein n=1 Tax=Scophthalmus maximus TaxID=52904 RepID=A0A8D3C6G4_SCOMX